MNRDDDRYDQHGGYNYLGGYTPNPRGDGNRDRDQGGYVRFDPDRYRRGRGFLARAGDEVASWFGSEEAERRRGIDAWRGDGGAGHHRGRGPRNYRRSDARIQEDVAERLTDDPYLDASGIEVTVRDAEVTLAGTVNGRFAKRRAEDLADSVMGVAHVQNNLRVRRQEDGGPVSIGPGTSGMV